MNNKVKHILYVLSVIFVAVSCNDPFTKERNVPEVITLKEDSGQDTHNSLYLTGRCVYQDKEAQYYFFVSGDGFLNKEVEAVNDSSDHFYCIIAGLLPEKDYEYDFRVKNKYGSIAYGEKLSKTTSKNPNDVKMDSVIMKTAWIEFTGSCKEKPSKAYFEVSYDKYFKESTRINANVSSSGQSEYQIKLDGDLLYSEIKDGLWYVRCCADDIVSAAMTFNLELKQADVLFDSVQELQEVLAYVNAMVKENLSLVQSLEKEKSSLLEEVKKLADAGLPQATVDKLNAELSSITFDTERNRLNEISQESSRINNSLHQLYNELIGISVLPSSLYQQYEYSLAVITKDIDYLKMKLQEVQAMLQDKEKQLYGIKLEIESLKTQTDLSESGMANCYIVTQSGNYSFNAGVKGSSDEKIDGTPSSAEVLWESYGTATAPKSGDLVNNAYYSNGKVIFTATGDRGNAVIAVKDASGNILWSWHIWLTAKPAEQIYNNNAGIMMDRNLGATSATKGDVKALGLLYQWGRKDPFLGSSSISSSTVAASSLTWPSAVSSDASCGTISYAVAHPTTFITQNKNNYDWYYTGSEYSDSTRWQPCKNDKGIYDPCPAGWRVPDGASNGGVWSKAFDTNTAWTTASNWDSTNKGMDFGKTDKTLGSGTIWYPATGCRNGDLGSLSSVGYYGTSWSCTPSPSYYFGTYFLFFRYDGRVNPTDGLSCAIGQSVRCLKDDRVK